MKIKIKRVYEGASKSDGIRILVDRLWPRGMKKEDVKIDKWMKEIGPSDKLRKWFNHDPKKWIEFRKNYIKELKKNNSVLSELILFCKKDNVTLVYSARDENHNQALIIKEFLESLN